MIVGTVYLTKKARKAYRKHQAEKAAQKLTATYDIADPSSELNLPVPPTSPTGSSVSLTTTPTNESPSTVFSEGKGTWASRSSDDLRSPLSYASPMSPPNAATGAKEFQRFVRRQSNDYLHQAQQQPPSYDSVVTSPISSEAQLVSPQMCDPTSTATPSSAYPSWPSQHGPHAHCPTCMAIMQQHQQHTHHFHYMPDAHFHPQQHPYSLTHLANHGGIPRPCPAIPEMPDQSVYQQRQFTESSRPANEAPDTGTYVRDTRAWPTKSPTAVELPAELPVDLSKLTLHEADGKEKEAVKTDTGEAKSELSA